MSKFVQLCELDSLSNGGMRTFSVEDEKIVLVRNDDKVYALKDECTHEEFPLSEGWVEEGCLHCAFHGAKFDLETGDPLSLPAYEAVKTYPVRISDGSIEVEID